MFMDNLDLNDIIIRLNGAILRKAEMEKDFLKFYTNIFERLVVFSFSEETDILELLGNMGG